MRITNTMVVDKFLSNMNRNMATMNKYTQQLATERKVTRLSDDPVGVLNSFNARQNVIGVNRYLDNLISARQFVEQNDSALQELSSIITEIRSNLVDATTNLKNPGDMSNIAKVVREYKDHIMEAIGNASIGGKYVFAGFNSTKKPFTVDAATGKVLYNGVDLSDTANAVAIADEQSQSFQLELGVGIKMEVTFNGVTVMGTGDDNIFNILDTIIKELESPNPDIGTLTGFLGDLDNFQQNTLSNLATIGARETRLELMENRYNADSVTYEGIMSDVEDIDPAEVIMRYRLADSIYQQALATGAKIIVPTLVDFLK